MNITNQIKANQRIKSDHIGGWSHRLPRLSSSSAGMGRPWLTVPFQAHQTGHSDDLRDEPVCDFVSTSERDLVFLGQMFPCPPRCMKSHVSAISGLI